MSDRVWCSAQVFRGWHRSPCVKPVTTERNGKWYCGIHDPERIAKQLDIVRETRERLEADTKILIQKLHAGRLEWGSQGPTGNIILTSEEVRQLLSRLGEV